VLGGVAGALSVVEVEHLVLLQLLVAQAVGMPVLLVREGSLVPCLGYLIHAGVELQGLDRLLVLVLVSLGSSEDDPAAWVKFQFSSKFGCWGSVMRQ
jgi:hypothetical protein